MSSKKPSYMKVPLIIASGLFLLSPLVVTSLNPNTYHGGRSRSAIARAERNTSAIANIVGEFRASVSDMIFIKTERYIHGGVAYQLDSDVAQVSVDKEIETLEDAQEAFESHAEGDHDHDHDHGHSHDAHNHDHADHSHDDHSDHEDNSTHDDHAEHDHSTHEDDAHDHSEEDEHAGHDHGDEYSITYNDEGADTLIPTAEKDFRGFIGYLERQVQPWKDPSEPHIHGDGRELLPWYRVMTVSDPHNVRAYVLGTWWLMGEGNTEKAFEFLAEGKRKNPDSFVLPYYQARIYINWMRDAEAMYDEEERIRNRDIAIEYLQTASELALKERPKVFDMRDIDYLEWSLYEEEDALAAIRMCILLLKNAERYEEGLALAKEAAPKFGYITEAGEEVPEDPKIKQYGEELERLIGVPFPLALPET